MEKVNLQRPSGIKTVYVAGPYTLGDVCENVRNAVEKGDILLRNGYVPYLPHLTHLWHMISPHPYETWIDLDLAWLARCDALLRLPSESPGAEKEIAAAKVLGIPVFYHVKDLLIATRST
jgi:hypothetical protein